jgi:N-acetylglucosaminyldiphosphoundecaprenol N-acetyl-beta-D-mannosaminyltransferase
MTRKRAKIMGTMIDQVDRSQALEIINRFLQEKQRRVVTPNAEFILQARHDKKFQQILNKADLAVVDGSGPVIASWFTGTKLKEIIPGSDLVVEILKIAAARKLRVALVNWEDSLSRSKEIIRGVKNHFGNFEFTVLTTTREQINQPEKLLAELVDFRPQILFVGLGSPMQDLWIEANLKKLPIVSLAMGIGGSFDFISGQRKRAPRWLRRGGLEWLYRLFARPRGGQYHHGGRIRKIFRSVIIFPLIFVFTLNRG